MCVQAADQGLRSPLAGIGLPCHHYRLGCGTYPHSSSPAGDIVMAVFSLRRFARALFIAAAALSLLAACTEPNPAFVEPSLCENGESLYRQDFQAIHPDRLDVVFVVDTTAEAAGLRGSLREAAPLIIEALEGLDYRVGVVTTDSGGLLYQGDGEPCTASDYVTSSSPAPENALTCLLSVDENIGVPPAAFEAAIVAGTASANPGFIRPDARLRIIVVSAHDDCSSGGSITWPNINDCEWQSASLVDPDDLAGKLRRLKVDRNAVAVATITGPHDEVRYSSGNTPVAACTGTLGGILHGNRYHAVADALSPWSYNASACTDDVAPALTSAIGQLAFASESRYCLGKPATRGVRSIELIPYEGASEGTELSPNAEDGFAYIGHTALCETGEVSVGIEGRQAVTATNAFKILFCGL